MHVLKTPTMAALLVAVLIATLAPCSVAGADVVTTPLTEIRGTMPAVLNDRDQLIVADYQTGSGSLAMWSPAAGLVFLGNLHDGVTAKGTIGMTAINQKGLAVGVINSVPKTPFVLSFATQRRTALDHGAFTWALPSDIADDGTIVGYLGDGFWANTRAVAWVGAQHELQLLPDLGYGSDATSVNEHGLAGGWMLAPDGTVHPAIWDLVHNTVTDLSTATGPMVQAGLHVSVNELGQVLVPLGIGNPASTSSSEGNDVLYDTRTGTLHPLFEPGLGSQTRLNDVGQVVFYRYADAAARLAGVAALVMVDTATDVETVIAPAFRGGGLYVLNDLGQVLYRRPADSNRAFLYDPVAGTVDLGTGLVTTVLNNTGLLGGYDTDDDRAWTAAVPLGPPPPDDVRVSTTATGVVTLTWTPTPGPTGRRPVTGYQVFRDGELLASVDATTTLVTDAIAADGVAHTYAVVALNGQGASTPATVVAVLNPPPPAVALSAGPASPVAATPDFTG